MSTVDAYRQLQLQIQNDIAERRSEFKQSVKAIKVQRQLFSAAPSPLIMVGVGDSWFDYPLPLIDPTDVLQSLKSLANVRPTILKLAHYGEVATDLLGQKRRDLLIQTLTDPDSGPVDAILFSGGGNDLIGDQFRFWLNDAQSVKHDATHAINQALVDDMFAIIRSAYDDLIGIRNQYAKNAALVFHAYDFAKPTGVGVCGNLKGPWLQPSLVGRGWTDLQEGAGIVKSLLEQFQTLLSAFHSSKSNIYVVQTHGTLKDNEWANELHPTSDGFGDIAKEFLATLRSIEGFKDRI
jgi:hypothetical protein